MPVASDDDSLNGGEAAVLVEHAFDASEVRDLSISWRAGSVVIDVYDVDSDDADIIVEEECVGDETAEADVRHGELTIRREGFENALSDDVVASRLLVHLPSGVAQSLGVVHLESQSSDFEVRDMACELLQLDVVSGEVDVEDVRAGSLEVEAESGDVEVDGSFAEHVSIKAAAGDVEVSTAVTPTRTAIEVASGDVELKLPRKASFAAWVQAGAGDFSTSFDARQSGETYLVRKGRNSISVSMESGSVRIDQR